jgi:hypothetical protein
MLCCRCFRAFCHFCACDHSHQGQCGTSCCCGASSTMSLAQLRQLHRRASVLRPSDIRSSTRPLVGTVLGCWIRVTATACCATVLSCSGCAWETKARSSVAQTFAWFSAECIAAVEVSLWRCCGGALAECLHTFAPTPDTPLAVGSCAGIESSTFDAWQACLLNKVAYLWCQSSHG